MNITRRIALDTMVGQVLPSAWNIDEQLKIMPLAAKFHELITSICTPTATTAASVVKMCMKKSDSNWHSDGEQQHEHDADHHGPPEGFAHALGLARAEVLAGDRRGANATAIAGSMMMRITPCPTPNPACAAAPKSRITQ